MTLVEKVVCHGVALEHHAKRKVTLLIGSYQ